jgi:hypothetical protein
MSLFVPAKARCRTCGAESQQRLVASVNAVRRPDLRQEILEGTFQALDCEACGARLRLPIHLSYLDIGRGQWILAEGTEELARWQAVEADAQGVFDRTYGRQAPALAQEIGTALRPRLVFGWTALRETLLADEAGLDPVTLEILKLAVIRNVPDAPLADTTELRLIAADDESLLFAWVDLASEDHLATLPVQHRLYDAIVTDAPAWAAVSAGLEGRLFLDLRRLIYA